MTYSIKGVEIFAVGTWNGDKFTVQDLFAMAQAFNETTPGLRPFLKLGHDKNQKLLQVDGLPAAGWVDKVYVLGEKLVADFVDIPDKIYQLIQDKAYRKVSIELFYNTTVNDKKFQYLIGAVSLLGADMPGVGTLNDILGYYTKCFGADVVHKDLSDCQIEFKIEPNERTKHMKTEAEIKLELELEAAKKLADKQTAELKEFTAKKEADAKEVAELREFKATQEKRNVEILAEAAKAKTESFISLLEKDKLATPAMKPFIKALLGSEQKNFSIKVGEKETKFESKEDLLKETLQLFKAASEVNFEESSSGADAEVTTIDEDAAEKAINEEMAKDASLSFGAATKKVLATFKSKRK